MTKHSIICISDVEDAHIPYVQRHLDSAMLVVFGRATAEKRGLSYEFARGRAQLLYEGRPITSVKSVWYRKPKIYPEQIQVPPEYKKYALSAMRIHADAMLSLFPDAFWLSDYYAILRASSKPWQQIVAHRLGFHIPDTTATSDAQRAKQFLAAHNRTVVKTQAAHMPVFGTEVRTFPTTLVQEGETVDMKGLHLSPAIFQQAIDFAYELRVSVVGDKVFTGRIVDHHAKDMPAAMRDWRINHLYEAAKFEAYDLPPALARQCVSLVKELGLRFGAIDLIVDKKGKVWFLEINPNGQWAFIEDDTDLPIGKAIADLLAGGGR
ncbi:MAG TPA: hypothetical protein VLF69_04465 [Candidatus Saccharimonadales bacterium]|nr:hypothetical protein [Candidatus Saccharimonadales bacterium]